jgi:small subunit ribosomal protein S6
MNKYEAMYIISPTLDEERTKAIIEKFKHLTESQAQFESVDEWGKKRLAYEVQDQKDGYYVLMHFSSASTFPAELERNFKITDGVMKYLVIRKDA